MDDIAADLGELIFSLLISYVGALEFFFILRQLCHFSGNHPAFNEADQESLQDLKEKLQRQLDDAKEKERQTGQNTMKDGVAYADGFRIDAAQAEIDKLKEKVNAKDAKEKRRAEIEAELARQKKIEQETRKQLEEAEAELARQRAKATEEEERKKQQQQQRQEQQDASEEAENFRRLLAAEKQREAEQRSLEQEAEKQARLREQQTNSEKLLEAEKKRELEQKNLEDEAERERKRNNEMRQKGKKEDETFLAAEQLREDSQSDSTEAQTALQIERENKQKVIKENARKFLEAEQEMVQLQQNMLETAQYSGQVPVVEEPIVKRTQKRVDAAAPASASAAPSEQLMQTVKTQIGQSSESFTLSSKPLLFPSLSDDASSNEPHSSKQSSFSTQPSEEMTTGAEEASNTTIGLPVPQQERQEPDGEDNAPSVQYTEDYLRSLDGLKVRPLTREDGSGRRRAFKKRRSSGSSNSSRDSRTSRDEELKMFTSLEEEELKNTQKGDEDFTPIKYTSEPALKVKGHHHRRHKRSPAKDTKTPEDSLRTSLEMLGEEGSNPWGEVVPEHYKNSEFWQREKAISIDEEEIELETRARSEENRTGITVNEPNSSSFEEATDQQNQEALSTLKKQPSKEQQAPSEPNVEDTIGKQTSTNKDANLQCSHEAERSTSPARSSASASPRLRRSPRVDEINQMEERWKEQESLSQPNSPTTPTIAIHTVEDVATWRDEHGLIMQGLSDFYDFTASTNPSRSRSTSRNPSPASSKANTPLPENTSFRFDGRKQREELKSNSNASKSYDDTGNFVNVETKNIATFIESFHDEHIAIDPVVSNANAILNAQEPSVDGKQPSGEENVIPTIFVKSSENSYTDEDLSPPANEMNELIESLRRNRQQSRSRSRSPLPTADNIERSLEIRRLKLIQKNDEIIKSLEEEYNDEDSPNDAASGIGQNNELCLESNDNSKKIALHTLNPDEIQIFDRRRSRSRSPLCTIDNSSDDISSPSNEMNEMVESLRRNRQQSRSRSRSPLPTADNIERSLEIRRLKLIQKNDEIIKNLEDQYNDGDSPNDAASGIGQNNEKYIDCNFGREKASAENIPNPDESLLFDKRRARSRSPLPTRDNLERSLEMRRSKLIHQNDELFERRANDLEIKLENTPVITVEHVEEQCSDDIESRENISDLVASLRVSRSRSRSKSPMRIPNASNLNESISHRREKLIELNDQYREHLEKRALSPEPPRLIVEYVFEIEESAEDEQAQSVDDNNSSSDFDFQGAHNLGTSTEAPKETEESEESEEIESALAAKQRHLDKEALYKLKNASEETELRTLTPLNNYWENKESEGEESDTLSDLPARERLQKNICAPSTPDYDRTISEECRDVQRIKNEMLSSGFKRSTYVGESMELGSEYEQLRREAATFRRSRSPSPSIEEQNSEHTIGRVRQTAAERRQIQDKILKELILNSSDETKKDSDKHGAKPKTERRLSGDTEPALSKSDDLLSSNSQKSNYDNEELADNSELYEEMRREMAEFRRSRSCSRSPTDELNNKDLIAIDIEAAKREFQDQILDKISTAPVSFQDFSRHLNANFLDDRRASDSAVIHKPEKSIKYRENIYDLDMEPEEYHHYRRFSLNQEQQTEEYPNDDFMYISQIEVRSLDGIRTWIQEDYYSDSVDNLEVSQEGEQGESEKGIEIAHDEEETEDSEDERQTVVEVDDEIDTDICDFNERGPTDESHHEQSECEEADRAMDHYANCEATDWQRVSDLGNILNNNNNNSDIQAEEEGAVGGMDSDSFEIDQIYDEAIKNRKQSGILREYDSILLEMQKSFESNPDPVADHAENKHDECDDKENYALWAKTRNLNRGGTRKLSVSFLETEKHDTELRYLGDAKMTARQSTRLRSRYGFVPQLKSSSMEDVDGDVDYKPKREYNWRKNFKLDDEDQADDDEASMSYEQDSLYESKETFEEFEDMDDSRKYSLGGESITLYSRSPDRDYAEPMLEEENVETNRQKATEEIFLVACSTENKENAPIVPEKPKKKKTKKKAHRESKESIENRYKDDDDSDSQVYSRRSSSRQLETESPKRKSRSRRGSRSSITNDDTNVLFSPRNSVAPAENTLENLHTTDCNEPIKKKVKKRKKVTDVFAVTQDIKEEHEQAQEDAFTKNDNTEVTSSSLLEPASLTDEFSSANNVSVSTASKQSFGHLTGSELTTTTTTITATTMTTESSNARTTSSSIDTFDILKDASFYPLF